MAVNHQDESFKICPMGPGWGGRGRFEIQGAASTDPAETASPGSGLQEEGHSIRRWKKDQRPAFSSRGRRSPRSNGHLAARPG